MPLAGLLFFLLAEAQVPRMPFQNRFFAPLWVETAPSAERLLYEAEALGGRVRTRLRWFPLSSVLVTRSIAERLASSPQTRGLFPVAEGRVETAEAPTPEFPLNPREFNYGPGRRQLEILGVIEAHEAGYLGSGVVIGVLDTGFDSTYFGTRHLFRVGRILAAHDFNSGDHLITSCCGPAPLPFEGSIRYINGLALAAKGDSLALVYSIAPEDSLYGLFSRNRWTLWMSLWDGTGWLSLQKLHHADSFAIRPTALYTGDTLLFAWSQAGSGGYRIDLSLLLPDGTPTPPVQVADGPLALEPKLVRSRGTPFLYWYEAGEGVFRVPIIGGVPGPVDTIGLIGGMGAFGGLGVGGNGTVVALSVRDTVRVFTWDTLSETWVPAGTFPGVFPAVHPDVPRVTWSHADTLKLLPLLPGSPPFPDALLLGYATGPVAFSGDTILFPHASGRLLRVIPSEVPDTVGRYFSDLPVATPGLFAYRRRGDDFVGPEPGEPFHYHGTEMLSLIAGWAPGDMIGAAPGASFVLAKTEKTKTVSGRDFEHIVEEDFWAEGMEWAVAHGARIISSSLGYVNWYRKTDLDGRTPISSRMASQALARGALVVTAMGNTRHPQGFRPDSLFSTHGDTTLVAPADAFGVLAVGGVDSLEVPVSNQGFGPTADGRLKPEVVAPYQAYWPDSDRTLKILSGTSIATALTAGALALVLEAHPSWAPQKLREVVLTTARQIPGYPDSNYVTGHGIPDVMAAIEKIEPPEQEGVAGDVLLPLYPNPYDPTAGPLTFPYQLYHTTDLHLWVLTLRGEVVWDTMLLDLSPGRSGLANPVVRWNGRTRSGRLLAPGLYLVLMRTGFATDVRKLAVVR